MRLWPGDDLAGRRSAGAVQRASRTAAALGLSHRVLDLAAMFDDVVVRPFEMAYLAGDTPNPCVACNPMRLAGLVRAADESGFEHVATGHYARLVWRDGRPHVARGADRSKDQSYMLWAVPPEVLGRLEFPLGDMVKSETRAAASAAGLEAADGPESHEVCFAADGYQAFLASRGVEPSPGAIVTVDGTVVGTHAGHWRYTIGQRRGLGVSAPEPLYVLERRAAENEVVVGGREALDVRDVWIDHIVDRGLGDGRGVEVQLRYRSAPVPVASLHRPEGGGLRVGLGESFAGAAPGQAAVFYREDVVVGGGTIGRPARSALG